MLGKSAIVVGVAALTLGSITASEARSRAWVAGAAGFAAGAAIGAAAASANSGYYYGQPAYGYAYEPAYTYSRPGYSANAAYYGAGYDRPSYAYTGDPAYNSYGYVSGPAYGYGYDSSYSYNTNTTSPWQERRLQGRDY
jgi:hypothetical protein